MKKIIPLKNHIIVKFVTKVFFKLIELEGHEKYHRMVKKFACKTCDKSFIFSKDLGRHMKIHTGERPFKCVNCSKAFIRHDKLKIHEKSHRSKCDKISKESSQSVPIDC